MKAVFDRLEFVEVYRIVDDDGAVIEEVRSSAEGGRPHVAFSDAGLRSLPGRVKARESEVGAYWLQQQGSAKPQESNEIKPKGRPPRG